MTSAQVVKTSVTNNSSFQNYTHPDDHTYELLSLIMLEISWWIACTKLITDMCKALTAGPACVPTWLGLLMLAHCVAV